MPALYRVFLISSVASLSAPLLAAPPPVPAPAIPSAQDAPIALLVDVSSGQTLFARDADRRFMPASITKVMTAYLAFQRLNEGKLFQDQLTAMRPETFRKWGGVGSTMYLGANMQVRVDDLVHGVTTVSANDGAAVLAEAALGSVEAWVAEMNRTARVLAMRDTHFGTPNGWMDEGATWTTARDLVTLGTAMITRYPSYYSRFVGAQTFSFNGITQRNHDPITGVVPGADGIKTGFTNQAGYGFLGSAQRGGRRLMMVIATSPTGRARNNAARSLLEWGFTAFDSRLVFPHNTVVGEVRVQDGGLRRLGLVPQRPIRIAMPRGQRAQVTMRISYVGPVRAPIRQGEPIADLLISLDGKQVSSLPLVAQSSVSRATQLQRVFNGIASWLPW